MAQKITPKKYKKTTETAKRPMKEWQKDLLSVLFIYALVLFLFSDYVFQNKIFSAGGDVSTGKAVTTAGKNLTEKESQYPLWFPYMFSGMPGLASAMYSPQEDIPVIQYMRYFNPLYYMNIAVNVLFLNRDHSWEVAIFFFAGLFMFLLARSLGFHQGIALTAAIAYMFFNFLVGSVAAGHGGKAVSMAYMPLIVWSVLRFFKDRSLLNWSIMGFCIGTFFNAPSHTQIVYYTFLMLGIYFIFYAYDHWKNDKMAIVKNGLGFGAATLIGLGFGALGYFSQYVYSAVTMRGMPPAMAEAGATAAGSGMTFDYITMWSFHPLESVTFFIPSFFGMESPLYWGWLTFTSSTYYFGLLTMVAAIFAVVFRRTRFTWFLITVAVVALLISFGQFFEPFFKLVLTVLPFFDKFRVPSMILSLFAFAVTLLSCYGIDFLLNPSEEEKKKSERLQQVVLYLMIGAGAALLIGFLFKSGLAQAFSFLNEGELQRYSSGQIEQLKRMRMDILSAGFFKFIVFLEIILAAIYFRLKQKISVTMAMIILVVVMAVDMIIVNKQILHPQTRGNLNAEFVETPTIKYLKKDTTQFRIFPLTEHAQSASPVWTYYGLENIGGYSPAKMRIYQDIIEYSLYKGRDQQFPINLNVINMLNVKYLIVGGQLPSELPFEMVNYDPQNKLLVYKNLNMLPRAFFVKNYKTISTAKEVIQTLNMPDFNPAETAILEKEPHSDIIPYDSAKVTIQDFKNNRIVLEAYVDKPSLLVLSEIYYPHGWKAFIDGNETEIYKTNYILRSIAVPSGKHVIEFRFEPAEYTLGLWVSALCFFPMTGLMITLVTIKLLKERKKTNPVI